MSEITKLEPKLVWELFDAITRVPRPSKKEEKIREFLVDFAKKHNIDYQTDQTGNVVMRVPGTKGYENRPCVILQSHMDMVCEKNSDTAFDFDKDPIRTKIVDGWVKAEGTTLGADDGIGMAAALAALLDPALEHGPLEALFTVDEETGLTGAFGLGKGMLTGRYLVNLDSEDEGEIFIGCAGGVDTMAMFRYKTETGMFWQVMDHPGVEGNYLETSGTALFAYAVLKGVRLGYLPKRMAAWAEKAFCGTCDRYLSKNPDGSLQLDGICLVAGLGGKDHRDGSLAYYFSEPVVCNDAKGVGPLVLAYTEMIARK